jgi:uncharacterized membrane protein YfcA
MTGAALVIALGFAGGICSGLFGVSGAVMFVPALTLGLGLSQLHAQATSLAAIIPAVAVGAWLQTSDGNVNWAAGSRIGCISIVGVAAGAFAAQALSGEALRTIFAGFLVLVAARMIHSSIKKG